MASSMLETRDTLSEARILAHGLYMAADALPQDDKNAVAFIANLIAERLDEVAHDLERHHKAMREASCAS